MKGRHIVDLVEITIVIDALILLTNIKMIA